MLDTTIMARRWALVLASALLCAAEARATDDSRRGAPPVGSELGAPSPEAPLVMEKKIYRVAAIGDSLTAVRSHGGKYLAHLKRKCPESRFDNYGRGGENVRQMRRRFGWEVLGHPRAARSKPAYTHVIVFGGVNDVLAEPRAGRSLERIVGDLEAMYAAAKRAGIRVVGVTLSPWGGYTRYYNPRRARATEAVNRWILAQLGEGNIDHAVDAHSLLSCGEPGALCRSFEMPWIRDGLHFNEAAHEKLGQALYDTVFSDCR